VGAALVGAALMNDFTTHAATGSNFRTGPGTYATTGAGADCGNEVRPSTADTRPREAAVIRRPPRALKAALHTDARQNDRTGHALRAA
jgi:hypothetical protein